MLTGDIPFRVLGLVLRFFLAPYVGTRGEGVLIELRVRWIVLEWWIELGF